MRFSYSDEQLALREVVRDLLSSRAGAHGAADGDPAGEQYDAGLWLELATGVGAHGIAIPEEHGGSGAGLTELAIVLEEMGRTVLPSAFFASVVMAAGVLLESGDSEAMSSWLPGIASGELVATLAHVSDQHAPVRAEAVGTGWRLTGASPYVLDGDSAALMFVVAETPEGAGLFAVDAAAAGLEREPLPVLDRTRRQTQLRFQDAAATRVGTIGAGREYVERATRRAAIALAAETVGVAQGALDLAVEYAATRTQFGRPIGSFQAIKHKLADMLIDVETSRAMTQHAAWSADTGVDGIDHLASLVLAHVVDAANRVTGQLLQILGGIGYTWEHPAHHYLKRARGSAVLLGSADLHREFVAKSIGLVSTPG